MKSWSTSDLDAKGIRYTVQGGAGLPASEGVSKKRAGKKKPPLLAPRNRPAVERIVVELDAPPSANSCWVNVPGVGRVRSPSYRRWHRDAAKEAALTRGRIEGQYSAHIELGELHRGSDVDNRTKPTLDMLAGLLTDDDQTCVRALAEWAADVPPRRMRVTLIAVAGRAA